MIFKIYEILGFTFTRFSGIPLDCDPPPSQALQEAVAALPQDEATFMVLAIEEQADLVAVTTKQQRKDLNAYQRRLVQKARIKGYTGQDNPPEGSLDSIALDALADALQAALDEGVNTVIKAEWFQAWLDKRAAVKATFPYPPDVPD